MADNLLYFTELLSMPVVDLKGRRIGRVKDAAIVPLVHASRIDRLLVGGADTWRDAYKMPARPASIPLQVYTAIFTRCTRTPSSNAAASLPPTANTWRPNDV